MVLHMQTSLQSSGGHHMVLHMQTSAGLYHQGSRAPYGVARANLAFVIIFITAHMGGRMRHPIGCCLRTAGLQLVACSRRGQYPYTRVLSVNPVAS